MARSIDAGATADRVDERFRLHSNLGVIAVVSRLCVPELAYQG